jgi:hypothetical protein
VEAESRGPPLAGVGGAASGSGDENRPSVCSRASRRAQTPPDRADPRHPASRISMPPSCGDANQAISRAKIRDTGSADTGGAEDGGTDTGSADAGSVRDDGAGGATGGGDGGDGATGYGGSAGGDDFSAKISSSPNEAASSPERRIVVVVVVVVVVVAVFIFVVPGAPRAGHAAGRWKQLCFAVAKVEHSLAAGVAYDFSLAAVEVFKAVHVRGGDVDNHSGR